MTVKYIHHVSSINLITVFKLLFQWRGSILKLIWFELIIYVCLYALLSCTYRFLLNAGQKELFEQICVYCSSKNSQIPLSFLLGFFISIVLTRWWGMVNSVPWLSKIALYSRAFITHKDQDKCLEIRKDLLRYLHMAWILRMRQLSPVIDSRFTPNCKKPVEFFKSFEHINDDDKISKCFSPFFRENEIMVFYEIAAEKCQDDTKKLRYYEADEYWLPFLWAIRLVEDARTDGYIDCNRDKTELLKMIECTRGCLTSLSSYNAYNIPLTYVQVVVIGVYSYFFNQLFTEQFLDPNKKIKYHEVDFYVPIYGLLEFIFYLGWFKVGRTLINPLGKDDEDLPVWDTLDWNLEESKKIALRVENLPYYGGETILPPNIYAPVGNLPERLEDERILFTDSETEDYEEYNEEYYKAYERHRKKYSHNNQFEGSARHEKRMKVKKSLAISKRKKKDDWYESLQKYRTLSMERKIKQAVKQRTPKNNDIPRNHNLPPYSMDSPNASHQHMPPAFPTESGGFLFNIPPVTPQFEQRNVSLDPTFGTSSNLPPTSQTSMSSPPHSPQDQATPLVMRGFPEGDPNRVRRLTRENSEYDNVPKN